MLEISKMLTISSAHISSELADKLDEESKSVRGVYPDLAMLTVYRKKNYGWMIFVGDLYEESVKDFLTIAEELIPAIRLALNNDCEWLCIDCDGLIIDELPTYDWP